MAGATARRSSMASSPLTAKDSPSFFQPSLQLSQTCFSAATSGSSFRPLGVVSRGNCTASLAARAASQVSACARASKQSAAVRNFSP